MYTETAEAKPLECDFHTYMNIYVHFFVVVVVLFNALNCRSIKIKRQQISRYTYSEMC